MGLFSSKAQSAPSAPENILQISINDIWATNMPAKKDLPQPIDYHVIEYKEILREAFSGLLADVSYMIKDKGLSFTDDHPLCILRNQINDIWCDILSSTYSTMEDMIKLRGQFEFLQTYVKALAK